MNSATPFFSQNSIMTQYSPFQLLKQTSQSQERISINGIQKLVHVVVKNSAFTVKMGLTSNLWNSQVIDLNNFTFDSILLYDTDVGEKGVDYVKVKPVEFKSVVNDSGDHVNLELRIKVLTSQHENSFFRVKIVMLNPTTGLPFHPAFTILTEPVKVISKPEQMKKKQTPQKKRSVNDMLVDSINRIEQQQQEQQKLIEKLLQQAQSNVSRSNEEKATETSTESEACTDFEKAFKRFFQAYNSLPPEEKPVKIRKVVRNSSTRDTERISELLDLFLTEGLQRGSSCDSRVTHGLSDCKCDTCPYQKELERIDEFYKDFLSVNMLEGNQENLFFAS